MKPTFRCSESDRVLTCPGSIILAPLVDARDSEDGFEGSHLHFQSALRIVRDLGGTAPDGLGNPDPSWPSIRVSGWIADFYLRHITETVPEGFSLETEVALAFEFDRFILSGHIDCLAVSPDATEAIGFDLKTGFNYVDEAEFNEQVFSYSGLLKRAYPTLKKIQFYVTQPRADEDDGHQRVTVMELSGDRLERSVGVLEQRFNAALDNSMTVNSGMKQCRFCPASQQCPATIKQREEMKLTLTPELIAQIKRTPDDATLADWVLASKTLARPMEDAEVLAKERIAKEGSITARDGTQITVKTTKGSIKILDPLGLWTALHGLLPGEKLAACARWSFTALKDAAAEHLNIHKGGKGATTGETVVATATGKFVQQGERKTLTFT